ncbi:MAG: hypothetical protein PHI12_15155, partial [Dehalococcoidales bacterium]|nr:hypothetical protein [Dehalococcoidales bacterium]
ECSDSGVDTTDTKGYSGYIWARIDDETSPSLADLTGAPFGAYGSSSTSSGSARRSVGGEVYPINKMVILAPWLGLAGAIIAGAYLLMRHRSARRASIDQD